MTRSIIAGGAIAVVLVLLALAAFRWLRNQAHSPAITASTGPVVSEGDQGFLCGCLTTNDGDTYEGRIRWGGDAEAFWGDYFNGYKDKNPWAAYVPSEQLFRRSLDDYNGIILGAPNCSARIARGRSLNDRQVPLSTDRHD